MEKLKIIGVDILGVLLLVGALLFGWLPGPGGIPMLLAGLGLLAINHEWARKLLEKVRDEGIRFADAFFKDHPLLMFFYDALALVLLAAAVYVFTAFTNNLVQSLAAVLTFVGIGLFLGNRKRLQRLEKLYKRRKNKR